MILAIDPGTNSLGWAVFNDQEELVHAGSLRALGSKDRLQRSLDIIRAFKFMEWSPKVVVLEDPLLRGMSNNAMQRILGMIELTVSPVPIKYYSPMTVKAAMGSGTLDKAGMLASLQELMPANPVVAAVASDHDAIDAICIGLTHFKKEAGRVNNDNKQLSNPSKKASKKRKGKAKSRLRGCQKGTSTHKKKRK